MDKRTRYEQELRDARDLWGETKLMDIEALKDKGRKAMKSGDESEDGSNRPGMARLANA